MQLDMGWKGSASSIDYNDTWNDKGRIMIGTVLSLWSVAYLRCSLGMPIFIPFVIMECSKPYASALHVSRVLWNLVQTKILLCGSIDNLEVSIVRKTQASFPQKIFLIFVLTMQGPRKVPRGIEAQWIYLMRESVEEEEIDCKYYFNNPLICPHCPHA